MDVIQLGERIKARRQQLRVNQTDLAEMAGTNARTIHQIESGKGNPSISTLYKIFEVLGLELTVEIKRMNF